MNPRTAVVLGGSGLTGMALLEALEKSDKYNTVKVLTRRPLTLPYTKTEVIEVDFERIQDDPTVLAGDDIFCCLGTTLKKAGSKENFRKIDLEIPLKCAKLGQNQANRFILISSVGANPASMYFYLRTKGELEKAVLGLQYDFLAILRPGLLLGNRTEKRGGEKLATWLDQGFGWMLFGKMRKYKGIRVTDLASAMIRMAISGKAGRYLFASHEIREFGNPSK